MRGSLESGSGLRVRWGSCCCYYMAMSPGVGAADSAADGGSGGVVRLAGGNTVVVGLRMRQSDAHGIRRIII